MRVAARLLTNTVLAACLLAAGLPVTPGVAATIVEPLETAGTSRPTGVAASPGMAQSTGVLVGPASSGLSSAASAVAIQPSTVFYGTGSYLFYDSFESPASPWATYGQGWGSTDYRHADYYNSAYCAQGFAPAPTTYPVNYETWIVAGPIDMSQCQMAILRYEMWLKTEIYHDYLWAAVSTDGYYWDGIGWSGDSNGWTLGTIDLVNYCGEPQVWLAFVFNSDGGVTGEGAYLDGVTITVNNAPRTTPDAYATRRSTQKTVTAPGVLANDVDPNGDPITVKSVTQPSHGTVTHSSDGAFTYTPTSGFEGTDTFTYIAGDPVLNAPATTVTMTVGSAPTVGPDGPYRTPVDTPLVVNAEDGVLVNDADADGDAVTAHVLTDPTHGSLLLAADGGLEYTPDPGFEGVDSFTYRAYDGTLYSSSSQVQLIVGNVAPVAVDDAYTMIRDTTKVVAAPGVLGNDTDLNEDALAAALLTDPAHGSLSLDANGSFVYTPETGFVGVDSFTYSVTDGKVWSPPATVTIVVSVVLSPVYRFYNFTNNTHFFTSSAEEADSVIARYANVFRYEGIAYYTNPANNTQPLYRFYNRVSGSHFYTASADEAANILARWSNVFTLDGQTYAVNPGPVPNSIPVFRFFNKTNGSHFYTASAGEADMVIANWPHVYVYEGPAFWLGQ
jgi:hypothetical protein